MAEDGLDLSLFLTHPHDLQLVWTYQVGAALILSSNRSALKVYHKDVTLRGPEPAPPTPIVDADGFERYLVGSVLSRRLFRGKVQCLVKWQGYAEPTWEPENFLQDEAGDPILPLQEFLER